VTPDYGLLAKSMEPGWRCPDCGAGRSGLHAGHCDWVGRRLMAGASQLQNDAHARSHDPGLANDLRVTYRFTAEPAWTLANAYKPPPPLPCDVCGKSSGLTFPRNGLTLCPACDSPPDNAPWSSRTWWLWPLYVLAGRWGRR
jgi:hypothetical protein